MYLSDRLLSVYKVPVHIILHPTVTTIILTIKAVSEHHVRIYTIKTKILGSY